MTTPPSAKPTRRWKRWRALLHMLPEEFQPVYAPILTVTDPETERLVKAADKLSAYIKCVEGERPGTASSGTPPPRPARRWRNTSCRRLRIFLETLHAQLFSHAGPVEIAGKAGGTAPWGRIL
ncbi:MAG: YfbR-like 5'-deoxynucleotidase [Dysosmobacter sp.]